MPNWCHNTLTVSGDAEALAVFVERVREDVAEERLRAEYADTDRFGPVAETCEDYVAGRQAERRPLSFDALVPFDPAEWPPTYRTCFLCNGSGTRPDGLARFGADWMKAVNGCNGCKGTGQAVDEEGWHRHHTTQWGCKWDASFGTGSMFALGREGMDLDATLKAQGVVVTPTVVVYKFDTPWAPPTVFVEKASALFPDLEMTLQFGEPGDGFAGRARYVAGVAVESEDLEIEDVLAPEEMWF